MEAQDLITRRCGECLSCRGALRRRGAWRGAATTSALGSRWQRAPSAGRRRPRSRQGGGKRHGREMRERRVKGRGPKKPRLRRREQKKGRGVLRFWVVLLCRCTSCPCVKTRTPTLILHTWRSTCSRTDATKPESPSLSSPIVLPSCVGSFL